MLDPKNKTPFQCGQEDSFFNRDLNPRMIEDGVEFLLKEKEMILQYVNGFIDSEEFYNGC